MPWARSLVASSARPALVGLLLLGHVLPPATAEEMVAQASLGERLYVLRTGLEGPTVELSGVPPQTLARNIDAYAVAATGEGWLVTGTVERASGRRIALVRGDVDGGAPVRPPGAVAALQASPQPVVDGGEWVGLVWLEGGDSRRMGLRAAVRGGSGFERSVWVSAPGSAPQLAPEVVVLADGSWLAVWSVVRGGDEDIFFSWRVGDQWTRPARVHVDNAVPDVTPALSAQGLGAVAAWGRFEGGRYRVRVSRFVDGGWTGERWLSAEPGSHPYFVGDGGGVALVNPLGETGEWSLYALGDGARLESVGRWSAAPARRPVVRRRAGRWDVEFGP